MAMQSIFLAEFQKWPDLAELVYKKNLNVNNNVGCNQNAGIDQSFSTNITMNYEEERYTSQIYEKTWNLVKITCIVKIHCTIKSVS